jgi:hypothetical protein
VYAICLLVTAAEAALHDAEWKRRAAEEKLFIKLPDRVVSSTNFEEKSFGHSDPSDKKKIIQVPMKLEICLPLSSHLPCLMVIVLLYAYTQFPNLYLVVTLNGLDHDLVQEIRCYLHARAYQDLSLQHIWFKNSTTIDIEMKN